MPQFSLFKKPQNWSLAGIPDHQGVLHVGGRLGAAQGPAAFRRIFSKFKGREGVQEALIDFGNLGPIQRDVRENHRAAAALIQKAHLETGCSVVVGGGHDHGYSHLFGLAEAIKKMGSEKARLGCINIDAHLDVRKAEPIITSGSPFYLALESGLLEPRRLIEFGIQSHCNAQELWEYVDKKKIQVVPFERLRNGRAAKGFSDALKKLSGCCDVIAISLDLDAAAAAFAPGVSAPQAEGFSASEILEMMEIAGSSSRVASLGIFELNPVHDIDDRTARLGATAAYHFIAQALNR